MNYTHRLGSRLLSLAPVLALIALLAGCMGTVSAYKAAEGLEETAKVTSEHYYATLVELNRLKEAGSLAGNDLVKAQAAVRVISPLVDQLRAASDIYAATKSAKTEADLQAALSRAAVELSRLLDILRPMRRQTTQAVTLNPAFA